MKKIVIILILSLLAYTYSSNACTIIVVGKKATTDGSVIVSHTDAGADCRLRVVLGQIYPAGTMAPVYWGIQDSELPLNDYGKILGYIPQVERTYTYFHSAYSHINEYQLAIGESTMSQRDELKLDPTRCKQIMTVEQAQIFALQRCKTAKEALNLITHLIEKYGFLPSCIGESECLAIADKNEAWILEIFSVGPGWNPESGKPGAIWAAKRVPDNEALVVPNWSIIKQINESDTVNYGYSSNYKQFAIDKGWYDPSSGKAFIWQDVYAPTPREWGTSRFWLFYSKYAPELPGLPDRYTNNPFAGEDQYTQYVEPLSVYPFSVKPNKKISVQDIMEFQRSTFTGTIYDKENSPAWYYSNENGELQKSAYATPFPRKETRKLLKINSRRNVARARGEYGMIAQLRSWLPDEIGGIYYFYVDNAYVSAYVPVYTGVTDVADCYKHYSTEKFNENSIRWCVDFVENLMYLRWQDAYKDLRKGRDPIEKSFFDEQAGVDKKALELMKKKPKKAKQYLTELTIERMNKIHKFFQDFRIQLITNYTNNKQGI